jgi:hypothetical protein
VKHALPKAAILVLGMLLLIGGTLHPSPPCRIDLHDPPRCTHHEGIVLHGGGRGAINLWPSTSKTRTAATRARCQISLGGYPG